MRRRSSSTSRRQAPEDRASEGARPRLACRGGLLMAVVGRRRLVAWLSPAGLLGSKAVPRVACRGGLLGVVVGR